MTRRRRALRWMLRRAWAVASWWASRRCWRMSRWTLWARWLWRVIWRRTAASSVSRDDALELAEVSEEEMVELM